MQCTQESIVEEPCKDLWADMLEEFRSLGGVAENICLREGRYGRGLFPSNPFKPYKINIPPSLLVDVKDVRFEGNTFGIASGAHIGAKERSFLESYQREFAWGVARNATEDVLQMLQEAPPELREILRKPFGLEVWLREPTPEQVQERFLASRALSFKEGMDVVIPIVELANHGSGTGYRVEDDGVGLSGQTAEEILVQYGARDPLGMFLGWGFASKSEPFALSLAMGVRQAGLLIRRGEADPASKPAPFMPTVIRDGSTIYLSYLMLGHRKNPQLARGIFNRIMRDVGRADATELFDFIQHANRLQWLRLLGASEQAAVPLANLLRTLVYAQLDALSHSIGSLDL